MNKEVEVEEVERFIDQMNRVHFEDSVYLESNP
jgi:hypothetical protein